MKNVKNFLCNWVSFDPSFNINDSIELQKKIDHLNLNPQKWLHDFSVEASKQNKRWDEKSSVDAETRKQLKQLSKSAKNVRIESGNVLASVFINIIVDRDNVVTEIIEGKDKDDFLTNPYDYDYEINPENIKDVLDFDSKQIIYSISTKKAGEAFACQNCDGKGFLRCESCGGSGREQYVDGYFVSGEDAV